MGTFSKMTRVRTSPPGVNVRRPFPRVESVYTRRLRVVEWRRRRSAATALAKIGRAHEEKVLVYASGSGTGPLKVHHIRVSGGCGVVRFFVFPT